MKIHKPKVNDFGGAPVAEHDYACPVCWVNKAMLTLNTGVFNPCNDCKASGWEIRRRKLRKGKTSWSERR